MVSKLSANRAFYLLFGTASAVFILLVSLMVKIAPLTVDHTVYYCQQFMKGFHFYLPHAFPSLIGLLLIFILTIGFLLFTIQILRTTLFITKVLKNKAVYPKKLKIIASELGILDKVDVVKAKQSLSFCYGLLSPRICLSLSLINRLNQKELKAVLIHESYHLQSKDPLKILISQVIVSMFFFMPVFRDIHKFYSLSKEINADKLVSKINGLKNLQSALVKTLLSPTAEISGVASFATMDNLELRLLALVNPQIKLKKQFSLFRFLLSGLIFAAILLFLNLPVHAMADSDGNHSYYFMSSNDNQMISCFTENSTEELLYSKRDLFTPINYSTKH